MIEGVKITSLRRIPDERGSIYHMIRNDSPDFENFGEIYFSLVHPGAIKAWHLHKSMTLNYAVPIGKIKLALCDLREGSPTEREVMELFLGNDNYSLVTIPPRIANGFKGVGNIDSLIANCATEPHSSDEIVRIDPFDNDIPYNWELKHG